MEITLRRAAVLVALLFGLPLAAQGQATLRPEPRIEARLDASPPSENPAASDTGGVAGIADRAVWGVYADLVGRQWTASLKRRITVERDGEGRMVFKSSGIGGTTSAVIEPAGAGKLRWREGDVVRDGTIQADGSVVWVYGPNSFVLPYRHSISDGVLTVAKVGVEDGRYVVADVLGRYKGERVASQGAAAAQRAMTTTAPAASPVASEPVMPRHAAAGDATVADTARWGALAALPGHVWRSNATLQDGTKFFVDAHWDTPGKVLRTDDHNGRVVLYSLQPDGRIRMQFFAGGVPDSQWDGYGTVAPDGSVEFLTPAKKSHTHYRLDEQGRLEQRFYNTTDRKVTMAARYEKAEASAALTATGRRLNPLIWGWLSALPGRGELHESGSARGFVASSDGRAIYWLGTYQGNAHVLGVIRWSDRERAPVYFKPGEIGGYHLPEPDGDDGIFWRWVSPNTRGFDQAWVFGGDRLLTASIARGRGTVRDLDQKLARVSMQQQRGFDEGFRAAEQINARFDAGLVRAQQYLAQVMSERERAERSSRRADAWSRAVRQIDGMLHATDAVLQGYVAERDAATQANIAAIRQRAAEQRRGQAQHPQGATRTGGSEHRSSSAAQSVSSNPGASRAGTSSAPALAVEADVAPRRPAATNANSGQREVFIVCEVISMSGNESGAHGRGGALFISAVGRVQLQDNRAPNLQSSYAARVQSQFNRTGPAICETGETQAQVDSRIQTWKRAYPKFEHVMTGIDPAR